MMYLGGDFYKGIQTAFSPAFNYFIAKTSAYTPGNLYSGVWIILFSCFMLPLGGVKWDKWKMVSVYYFAQYCLLGIILATPKFYSDELLGFMSAALCAFFALKKERKAKDYVLVIIGLLSIAQLKDSYGAIFAVFSAIFIIVTDIMSNFDDVKKVLPRSAAVFAAPFAGYFLSLATLGKPEDYFNTGSLTELPILGLLKQSVTFIGLFAISVLLFVLLIVFICKKRKIRVFKRQIQLHNLIGIFLIISVSFLVYKTVSLFLVSLEYDNMQSLLNNGWKGYFYNSSGGLTNKLLYPMLGVFAAAVYAIALKPQYRKIFLSQMVTLFIIMISIILIVLFTYSVGIIKGQPYTKHSSWERYIIPPVLMMLSYLAAYFINANNAHITDERKRNVIIIALMLLFVRHMPYPGTNLLAEKESIRRSVAGYENSFMDDAEIIRRNAAADEKVFIVSFTYNEEEPVHTHNSIVFLRYCLAPMECSWYSDTGEPIKPVKEYLEELSGYDYLYIASAGESYYNRYKEMFPDGEYYNEKALYKISDDGTGTYLMPADLSEAVPLP